MSGGFVEVLREDVVESRHQIHVAVADARGRLLARVGDPDRRVFYRSAAKPLQALPLVEDGVLDALGWGAEELALACASHSGEERHVEGVERMLRSLGLGESDLRCGPHPPFAETAAALLFASGGAPTRVHNNCSGKHAGMLALALHHGWSPSGYDDRSHPVQKRMLDEVSRWSGLGPDEIELGVDGCGVTCFAVPLSTMATSFARFGTASEGGPGRVLGAMAGNGFLVGGTGRLDTRLAEVAGDRLVSKTGAEGVYVAVLRGRGIGVAVKVEDGAKRAADVALIHCLTELGALDGLAVTRLDGLSRPFVLNSCQQPVGEIRAAFELRLEQ